jgi:solute carrier family 8 (sodium/calcium exchanger)
MMEQERIAAMATQMATGTGVAQSASDLEQLELIKTNQLAWIFVRNVRMAAFENEGNIVLTVERIGCLDKTVTVDFTTEDETANAGEDFGELGSTEQVAGQLSFAPDMTEMEITVPIIDDNQWEPDETFLIKLSNPQVAACLLPGISGV